MVNIMNLLKIISFIALIISSNSYAAQSYELGLGTNYGGVVGVTINTEINSNVEMFAGLGLGYEALGYVVGSKFWLNENVRLTANYGINCVVSSPWRDYYGLNFGAGYAFSGKDPGWAFDLMLLDISDCNAATTSISSDSAIMLAAGYRF
jgi:hypothetical protein